MKTIFQKILDWHNDKLIDPPKVSVLEYDNFWKNGVRKTFPEFCYEMHKKYGDIYRVGKSYIISNPSYAQHILKDNEHNYVHTGLAWAKMRRLLGEKNSIFFDGEEWKNRRKIVSKSFTFQYLKIYVDDILANIIPSFLNDFSENASKKSTINLSSEIFKITYSAAINFFMQVNVDDIVTKQAFNWFFKYNNDFSALGNFYPSWKTIKSYFEKKKFLSNLHEIYEKSNTTSKKYEDMKDILIDAGLDKEEVIGELRGHIIAAMTTTTSAILWALYHIYNDEKILNTLREEIDTVLGDRELKFDDMQNLSYCKCVANEALRMYPSLGMFPKVSLKNDVFGKYKIGKGKTIVIDFYSLHRHSDYWDNPEDFNPDRFKERLKHNCSFIPFGYGQRTCVGNRVALTQMIFTITNIVRNFDLEIMTKNMYPSEIVLMMPPIDMPTKVKII